jgi:hypothetical protein
MRFAGGRATEDQLRQEQRKRVQKHRAKKKLPRSELTPLSVTHPDVTEIPNVTESPEISLDQRKAEMAALDMSAKEKAAKISAHALGEFIVACRTWLPKITAEDDRQKARRLVVELTSAPKAEAA